MKPVARLSRSSFVRTAAGACAAAALPRRADARHDEVAALYDAAKREGSVTWWTAHYAEDAAERVRDAFKKKYPGIEVNFIRQTAQVLFERASQGIKSNTRECDVFASTDEAHYPALAKLGSLATFRPPDLSAVPAAFHTEDAHDQYHTGAFRFVTLISNAKKVTAKPHRWADLLDPRYKGQVTVGHPAFSGVVGAWVVAMNDKFGWDYFTKLEANQPKIGRSVNDTVTDVVSGERTIGAGPDALALEQRAHGNPIDVTFPSDDAILVVSPVGIMQAAPHPNAARLFENFYYSREYSQAMTASYNFPLRGDMPGPSGAKITAITFYRNKASRLATGIPEVVARWRDTFGV